MRGGGFAGVAAGWGAGFLPFDGADRAGAASGSRFAVVFIRRLLPGGGADSERRDGAVFSSESYEWPSSPEEGSGRDDAGGRAMAPRSPPVGASQDGLLTFLRRASARLRKIAIFSHLARARPAVVNLARHPFFTT